MTNEPLNKSDDLIVQLLANPENHSKITLALANTKPYRLDLLDRTIMWQLNSWN